MPLITRTTINRLTRRRRIPWRSTTAILLSMLVGAPPLAAGQVPEIIVIGQRPHDPDLVGIDPRTLELATPDAAALMARVPGGNANFNGMLSGQLQYRGMFGPRMNARIDGMHLTPGGPNWMDPPLHYLPAALLDKFQVYRGIAPVSSGTGIGGYVDASMKTSRFTDGSRFEWSRDLSLSAHTVDDGFNAGGIVGLSNDRHRAHLAFNRDDGGDGAFGDGTIAATSYERDFYAAGYGLRFGGHEVGIDYRHTDTGDSGNPSLPLDIGFFDTDMVNVVYRADVGAMQTEARVYYSDIEHQMNNFRLRPAPDFSALPLPPFLGPDERFVDAESNALGYLLKLSYPAYRGRLTVGFDGHLADNDATVGDPAVASFFITNFNNANTDTYGFFAEWSGRLGNAAVLELGVRYDRVETSAGRVDAQPAQLADAMPAMCAMGTMPIPPPCAVRVLRDRFNLADRTRTDDNLDWVAKLRYSISDAASVELGFARKSRSPGYAERYLWIPLEVNSGLGDGNNYIGAVNLDPEVSHQAELGLDWRNERLYFAPWFYYRRVDDFIQGTAIPASPANGPIIGVSARANGDPTPLRFANVDAEFYGVDAPFGSRIAGPVRLDGTFSYVRGKRRDIDDDLFRIAPPSLRLALSYERGPWFASLEGVLTARQGHLSQALTNDPLNPNNTNAETPGHAIFNLTAQYRLRGLDARVIAGVENVVDKIYIDHLSGFNRVIGSDVPLGQRLAGLGRNGFVRIAWSW